jgi:hypothetical protein
MVGAGPMGEAERGEAAPRTWVSFWCANEHETRPGFSADAEIPETWECPRCGNPAGQDQRNPPARPRAAPYKTHLAYVKERRSHSDGEAILAEALARLRGTGSPRPPAPDPQLAAHAGGGEDRHDLCGRQQIDGDLREPAPASPPTSAGEGSHDAQELPGPSADEWCEKCGYRPNAPSHKRICLGQW